MTDHSIDVRIGSRGRGRGGAEWGGNANCIRFDVNDFSFPHTQTICLLVHLQRLNITLTVRTRSSSATYSNEVSATFSRLVDFKTGFLNNWISSLMIHKFMTFKKVSIYGWID